MSNLARVEGISMFHSNSTIPVKINDGIGIFAYYFCKVWVYVLSAEGPLKSTRLIYAVQPWSFLSM